MAASQGYQCEFVDSVFDDLYCKKCTLVAKRLTVTTCCGESFCHTCIVDTKEQGKPCLSCGEKDFTLFEHVKNRKRIKSLQVYCSMKGRGCDWSGTLEQLDTHLDPDQDNCQYVDTKCPLNCQQTTPKNKVEQHVTQHCAKRAYECRYCSFKATYEEVVVSHLPECKYVPLQCPNRCGVTSERDFMEDHMKICRLEEVGCEFSGVGCDDRFNREDQEEHTRQNSRKHLTLTASLAVETKEQLQQKLLEQDKKHKEEEEKLRQKIEEQEKELVQQKKQIDEQEKKLDARLKEQKEMLEQQFNSKLQDMKETLLDVIITKSDHHKVKVSKVSSMLCLNRRFEMKNFSHEKAKKTDDWKSPAMYTHVCGYKFCIGVDVNGQSEWYGPYIRVSLWSMPGKFDDQLNWETGVKFTVELVNQQEGENVSCTQTCWWDKPTAELQFVDGFICLGAIGNDGFLEHSKLDSFLNDDTLYFHVSNISVLSDCFHPAK